MTNSYEETLQQNTPLHTPRLTLRKFTTADEADVFEYASDPETTKYVTWDTHETMETSAEIVEKLMQQPGIFAIEFEGKCIGSIGIHLKPEHEKASIGYVLNRAFWGKGIMTEALTAVLKLCFEELKLSRVIAAHDANNPASGRVMQKCGMKFECVFIRDVKVKGTFRDIAYYSILIEGFKR